MDLPRILFASVLGVSVTVAVLWSVALFAGARAWSGRSDQGGGALAILASLGLLGGLVEAVTLASGRYFDARAPAVALLLCVVVVALAKPLRAAVRHAPVGLLVTIGALRAVGVMRLLAADAGWLPVRHAVVAAGSDALIALLAVPLAMRLGRGGARDVALGRAWAVAALVTQAVSITLAVVYARPMPGFEALRVMYLDVLFAGSHLALLASLRRTRAEAAA